VHELYFEPKYEEFKSRTIWSLSNAFTSAFKQLDPIPQFRGTAKHIRGNKWKAEWVDPNPGLVHYVESGQLVCL
jgi:hypothetical protein